MTIRWPRFNIYFVLALALALSCGCRSSEGKRKRALSTLALHLEANPDATKRSEVVTVHRDPLIRFNIESAPFVDEGMIKEARIIDAVGGFALSVQFDRLGTRQLEQHNDANRGGHVAIFSRWVEPPDQKLNKGRWIAAPKITKLIKDGLFVFTPDVTREEAEQIATGLNNVASKLGNAKEHEF